MESISPLDLSLNNGDRIENILVQIQKFCPNKIILLNEADEIEVYDNFADINPLKKVYKHWTTITEHGTIYHLEIDSDENQYMVFREDAFKYLLGDTV